MKRELMTENKRIKLKDIYIKGFQTDRRSVRLKFSDNKSTVLYGKNGSGKTTLLKIIHAVLNQDSQILEDKSVKKIEIGYEDENNNYEKVNIEYERKEREIERLYIKKFDIADDDKDSEIEVYYEYNWKEFNQSKLAETASLSMGVDRGISQRAQNIDWNDIYIFLTRSHKFREDLSQVNRKMFARDLTSYLTRSSRKNNSRMSDDMLQERHVFLQDIRMNNIEELLLEKYSNARRVATERIQRALFDTLSFIFDKKFTDNRLAEKPIISNDFKDTIITSKERIIEALNNDFEENQFKNKIIEILLSINTIDDVEEKIDNQILYDLISNMIRELRYEKLLLSSISTFNDEYNKFLGDEKKLNIKSNEIIVEIDGSEHTTSVLSSGERHLFTFLSLIIIESENRDFIFIDEPEISLNINWQRKIMKLLQEIAPSTQIIVASHSPLIAKKMPNSLVEIKPEKII